MTMMAIIDDDDVVVTAHAIAPCCVVVLLHVAWRSRHRHVLLLFFYTWHATWCLYVRKHGRERRQCRLQSRC